MPVLTNRRPDRPGAGRRSAVAVCVGAGLAAFMVQAGAQTPARTSTVLQNGLTSVAGLAVGHYTHSERPTGCTVVLAEAGAVAAVSVRGSAPGTRETDQLSPVNPIETAHAVLLAGGSAFGLDAAVGVMRYLEERGVGLPTKGGKVPIVPAAILFDLAVGENPRIRPTADCGYRAALAATIGPVAEGNVGAGAGATVGKLAGPDRAMKGGLGTAAMALPNGIIVGALAVVNAVGDVIDSTSGRPIAGLRTPDGGALADSREHLRSGATRASAPGESTTLVVVGTNARLNRAQATRLAQMAHDGLARAIAPAHTPEDGDTVFVLATGIRNQPADAMTLGLLASDAVVEAVVRGVRTARSVPGYPAAADLTQTATR